MFWESEGVILIHCVPKSTTVTADTYEDVLRMKFLPALRENRPQNAAAVFFHHDNASPHRAARVHQFSDDNKFEVVPHAPYSPDLEPSDFWLFPTLEEIFVVAHFQVFPLLQQRFSSGHNEPIKSVFCSHALVASAL